MTNSVSSTQVATCTEALDSAALLKQILSKSSSGGSHIDGVVVGRFDGFNPRGKPLVSVDRLGLNALEARAAMDMANVTAGSDVVLAFAMGDPAQALILACLWPDRTEADTAPASTPEMDAQQDSSEPDTEIVIDGERIVFQAEHEIELRCGDAAIILSSDGRIELRGTYITSKASATQRILGGSVNIN